MADTVVVIGNLLLPPPGSFPSGAGLASPQMCSADFSSCATSPCFLSSAHSPFQTSSLPVLTCPKCFLFFFFWSYWYFCPSLFPALNPLASCTCSPRKPHLFTPTPALQSCFASPLHSHFPVLSCLPLQSFYWWPTSPPLCSSLETPAHLTQMEIKIYENRRLEGECRTRPMPCLIQHTSTGTSCSRQEY